MSHKITDVERQWLFKILSPVNNKLEDLKDLLEKDPNLPSKKDFMMGFTALHWAVKNGEYDVVKFLLDYGVTIDARTNGGYTPLHLATMYNHNDIVLLLVNDYGAEIDARDHSGKRPKDYLQRNAMPSVRDKLRRTGSSQRKENPMSNISNMFMQMGAITTPQPFFLLPPEKKTEKKTSTRLSLGSDSFRKAKTKPKKPARVCDDPNAEAKLKIGPPIPLNNNFFDINGIQRDERTDSEQDVERTIKDFNPALLD